VHSEQERRVIAGVDAHTDTHHAAALDYRGALLGSRSFPVFAAGYRELLAWLESFGALDRIGVESTGLFAAGLTRHLVAEGVRVLEVNQPHAHVRRRRGKTDAMDAELAARHASGLASAVAPKQTTGIVEAIRQLRVARDSAVKSRSVAMLQLGDLIVTAPSGLREQLAERKTLKGQARSAGACDPTPTSSQIHSPRPSSRCRVSRNGSPCSTRRSPSSTRTSSRWSRGPLRAPPRCWASRPVTPASCSSPPGRTSNASTATAPSPRSAAPAQPPSPRANAAATASTREAIAKPTGPCT
jgi:Transposase